MKQIDILVFLLTDGGSSVFTDGGTMARDRYADEIVPYLGCVLTRDIHGGDIQLFYTDKIIVM